MVVQTRLNITLHVHCLLSLPLNRVSPQPEPQAGVLPLVRCPGQFNRHIGSSRNCVPLPVWRRDMRPWHRPAEMC